MPEPEPEHEETLRALHILWNGEPVALALSGFVVDSVFYGRTLSFRGWTDVALPVAELHLALNQNETRDLCPKTTFQSS